MIQAQGDSTDDDESRAMEVSVSRITTGGSPPNKVDAVRLNLTKMLSDVGSHR